MEFVHKLHFKNKFKMVVYGFDDVVLNLPLFVENICVFIYNSQLIKQKEK